MMIFFGTILFSFLSSGAARAQEVRETDPVAALAAALGTLRWVYVATLVAYGAGYAWGRRSLQKESL